MNLWTFLEQHVDRTPEKTLLRYDMLQQSYADFLQTARRAGSALHQLGVQKDDTVCLMLRNSPDYLYLWFGLSRLGAVAVPINVHTKGNSLAYIMEHSEARTLVIEADLLPRIEQIRSAISHIQTIVIRTHSDTAPYLSWANLLHQAGADCPAAPVRPEAVNSILYTSGTTGAPKGVMLSHQAYLNSARFFAEQMVGATSTDVLYTCLPLFHINAQAHTVLPAIEQNATCALGESFSASGFWHDIRRHEATIFNTLAAMLPILCKQPPSALDRQHSARITACAATPKDLWQVFEERFGVRIVEGYGLTETTGFCVTNPREATRIGSIGKPMAFVDVHVVDQEDQSVAANQLGEIVIAPRAAHVLMEGYYKMPEQTAQAMRGGWFHSGDMGYADIDGYLYFVDRIKQSIRRRGENISSWEVEQVLNAHPQVLESAAVGVPSELGEEDVKAYIVRRAGQEVEPLELIQWCEQRMAYFMVPRYIEFRDSLPKTATERVEKYKLKQEGIGAAWDREAIGYRLKRD